MMDSERERWEEDVTTKRGTREFGGDGASLFSDHGTQLVKTHRLVQISESDCYVNLKINVK